MDREADVMCEVYMRRGLVKTKGKMPSGEYIAANHNIFTGDLTCQFHDFDDDDDDFDITPEYSAAVYERFAIALLLFEACLIIVVGEDGKEGSLVHIVSRTNWKAKYAMNRNADMKDAMAFAGLSQKSSNSPGQPRDDRLFKVNMYAQPTKNLATHARIRLTAKSGIFPELVYDPKIKGARLSALGMKVVERMERSGGGMYKRFVCGPAPRDEKTALTLRKAVSIIMPDFIHHKHAVTFDVDMMCAGPNCPKVGYKMCVGCKGDATPAYYCSQECQRTHWHIAHKCVCKSAKEKRAAKSTDA